MSVFWSTLAVASSMHKIYWTIKLTIKYIIDIRWKNGYMFEVFLYNSFIH